MSERDDARARCARLLYIPENCVRHPAPARLRRAGGFVLAFGTQDRNPAVGIPSRGRSVQEDTRNDD